MNKSAFDKQVEQWELAAKGGEAKAALLLANHYHDIGDAATSLYWYDYASKQKDANPLVYFYLGYAYQYGEGTPIDMMEAFSMYKKAASYDVPQALYSLAYFYQNGIVVPKDEISAISYMKQATQKMDTLFLMQYDFNAEKERLQADISIQKNAVASLLQKIEGMLKENGRLSEQIIQAKSKIEERDKDKEELIRQSKFAEQQALNQRKELIEQYDQKILELKLQATELQEKNTYLTEQNNKLHTELQAMSNHENDLREEIHARDKCILEHMRIISEYERLVSDSNLQFTKK